MISMMGDLNSGEGSLGVGVGPAEPDPTCMVAVTEAAASDCPSPLEGELIVDLSEGIPGGYCTRQLADAGAIVVKLESPEGDPLRRWSASGAPVGDGDDGALFQFLASSKESVVIDPDSPEDRALAADLLAAADGVVWSPGSRLVERPDLQPGAIREAAPRAVVCAITPFGLNGSWSVRPANEFTISAMSGGAGSFHGSPGRPPTVPGGRLADWTGGMFAATAVLVSRRRARRSGRGELVDLSLLEAAMLTQTMYPMTFVSVAGFPFRAQRMTNLPAIHPTKDGFVGFMTVTGQQWLDFCVMVEQPQWIDDPSLIRMDVRNRRRAELTEAIERWTGPRMTEEIVDLAQAFRLPVAPIGNGETITHIDHFIDQEFYVENPRGRFLQPAVPYRFRGGPRSRPLESAPRLGEHTQTVRVVERRANQAKTAEPVSPEALPLHGIRVADFTAFWAGPIVGHILAMFGADVIHVESPRRPDGMRFNTIRQLDESTWWEWSPLFQGPNNGKRSLTLDLGTKRGRQLGLELIARCDVVVENYSPRVLPSWGLDYETVHSVNPAAIMVRMPAFGLDGPWRNRVGYAQTMEQVSGLAWLNGFPDGPPEVPNGPCDPIAGVHAATALLVALAHRDRTGAGMLLEAPMVLGALNLAAEQVIEHSAYGALITRLGNRGPCAAPQNLYPSNEVRSGRAEDHWIAISVECDQQWRALVQVLGDPEWATRPELDTAGGRRDAADEIDRHLTAWCASRQAEEAVETLVAGGVPASMVLLAHEQDQVSQVVERRFLEQVEHPVTGATVQYAFPARFEHGPQIMNRAPAPTLGQHNREILTELLGLDEPSIAALEADGIVGTEPPGDYAW